MRALRVSLSVPTPEYRGSFYSYGGVSVQPYATSPRVPLWVGGRSVQSLRRAVEFGDGWLPFALRPAEVAEMLAAADLPDGFDVVLSTGRLDPATGAAAVQRRLESLRDAGATAISCTVTARSAEHYVEQLHVLRELADAT